jgi:preprotein translocase subunit YajC
MEVAIVYFALLALAFFFLIVRPQRRRVSAHRVFVASLGLGEDSATTGGIYGTVRALRGDAVELEIAPGIVITVARAAIAQTAYPDPGAGADQPELEGPDADSEPPDDDGAR